MVNPSRQHVSSGSPYESRFGFARAVRIGALISIGGTAPLGPDGKRSREVTLLRKHSVALRLFKLANICVTDAVDSQSRTSLAL